MTQEEKRRTYEEFYGDRYAEMKQVERQLMELLSEYENENTEEEEIKPIIYTCSRIKTPSKMISKLERRGLEQTPQAALSNVYDAIGVRAVCAFAEDVYRLVYWLRTRSEIEIIEEKDYYANPKPNGYRSYHVLVNVVSDVGEELHAEIQIRTIANDFWATLEHRLKYKKNVPHEHVVQEELKRCAFEIASVDASMQAIRDLLKES